MMQFAGNGRIEILSRSVKPSNILVELADDTLPSPGAIMVTGITPQATKQDGMSEREFCDFIMNEIATPGTTIIGYKLSEI